MGSIAPARINVTPSLTLPEHILQINQVSGYMDALSGGDPMPRLGENDLVVYINAHDVRVQTQVGQVSSNQLPGVTITSRQISTPTYMSRARAEFDHHDTAAAASWGYSLPEAQRLGMRQATFQKFRDSGLYGINPTNGEGLLNTVGATAVNLPADQFGNTTVVTYDPGSWALFMAQQMLATKTRTMQMGMGAKFTILGPQRTLGLFEYDIVQLTNYQREGAGSNSAAGTLKAVTGWNLDDITWTYDDTLIGKGAGGTDMVILIMTEVKVPKGRKISTNEFAKLSPSLEATALQLCDMVAPREITTPLPGGATDVLSELRLTSGWGVRPEALSLISMQYS